MGPEDFPGARIRWSDDRLDDRFKGLDERMELHEDTAEAIRELPEVVGRLDERTKATAKALDDLQDGQRDLRKLVERRFDKVDTDHARVSRLNTQALTPRPFWDKFKDTMAVLIPIIIALIAAYATISAAGIGQQP